MARLPWLSLAGSLQTSILGERVLTAALFALLLRES